MTSNEALAGLKTKFQAKGLPPGIIQAILEAIIALFKQFCPAMTPAPTELQSVARSGLAAYQADNTTRDRVVLRRQLRRHLGFFSRYLDRAEGACWEIGSEASQKEIVAYSEAWTAERDSLDDAD